jgi:hypothetical protein
MNREQEVSLGGIYLVSIALLLASLLLLGTCAAHATEHCVAVNGRPVCTNDPGADGGSIGRFQWDSFKAEVERSSPYSPPPRVLTMEQSREAVIRAGEAHCRRWNDPVVCHAR